MRSTTYSEYLAVDELLSLQRLKTDPAEHDEMLFIIIHQVYELWFKQELHEIDFLGEQLAAGHGARAVGTLNRILTILKTLVAQIDVLETMTPLEFLSFRDRLDTASGFESFQFREFEFALGLKNPPAISRFAEGSIARANLERRLAAPSVWLLFLRHLHANGAAIPSAAVDRDPSLPTVPDELVQEQLIKIYREDTATMQVCERLVDLDEGVQEWRYRHVKMVQRTIGTKPGTGGSEGAEYLKNTLFKPVFPDLWAIRAAL